jgi:hypothetical protein
MKYAQRLIVGSFLLYATVGLTWHAFQHGKQWHFVYGTPELIVAPDGYHYLDGSTIDPVELALHRSGWERTFYLTMYLAAVYVFCPGLLTCWRCLLPPRR